MLNGGGAKPAMPIRRLVLPTALLLLPLAAIFTAVEKGYFKDEGLDVELVRCEWATYKDALALGRFDVTHHLVMYFLKPIEQGLDVKFTAGIHRGCLRVQAA